MYKLWSVVRNIYRWDHRHFDIDFDICALLTNEHIKRRQLETIENRFYTKVTQEKREEIDRAKQKRKLELQKCKEKKKEKTDEWGNLIASN